MTARPAAVAAALTALSLVVLGGCADDDAVPALEPVAVSGANPVGGVLFCEPGDLLAELATSSNVPPSIEVPPPDLERIDELATLYIADVLSGPARDARVETRYDGGPDGSVVLLWPHASAEARPGGWLSLGRVDDEWAITGYTICNRFAFARD